MYNITFEANGGYFNGDRQTTSLIYMASEYIAEGQYLFNPQRLEIAKDGYTFGGWRVKEGNLSISSENDILASSDGVVEAIWFPLQEYYKKTANGWEQCEIYQKTNHNPAGDTIWYIVENIYKKQTEQSWE